MKTKIPVVVAIALFLTLGLPQAQSQVRTILAYETTGLPHDFTILTDSVVGQLCAANEDVTACFATPYDVPSSMINPNVVANGGAFGIDFFDNANSDNPGQLSDQLYLTVAPAVNGMNQLTWCWDSDLEPNVNICPTGNIQLVEPNWGWVDVTRQFNGLLAAGQWQVLVLSESPEPSTFLMMGSGLLGLAGVMRRRLIR